MSNPPLNFSGKIPQNYEEFLGPFLFEPYAADIVGRLKLGNADRVLELACGSGRVTKHLANIIPEGTQLTASDLNAEMISVAQTKVTSKRINWAIVDMLNIPFDDGHFDLVVCQFGIMLVPDHLKALTEIFRVLKKGGQLIFSTWTDLAANKLWSISDEILNAFLEKSTIRSNPGPFAMDDQDVVSEMLSTIGFSSIKATLVEKKGQIATAAMAANGFIQGLPVSSFIQREKPALLAEIIDAFEKELIRVLGDNPLVTPQFALTFEATK